MEILLHGVPDGQDYYGVKEEQTNMGLFYDNSMESVKFVVETKKQGNVAYTYYSYLRYRGMIGAGGRPGSYFGITLRIDKYYQDALHIYQLLDIVFKRHIVGTLLTPSGEAYKYITPSFTAKSAEIEQAQQALIQLIQTTCVSSKFINIDASMIHPISVVPTGNFMDVSDAAILSSIKKYSKVVISPDYEMNIEKEYKKKMTDVEGKVSGVAAEKDKQIADLKSSIAALQNRITTLEQEKKSRETDLQQYKKNGSLTQAVGQIKEPITSLANYFRSKEEPQPETTGYNFKSDLFGMVNCALLVVLLSLGIYGIFFAPSEGNWKERVAALEKENQELAQAVQQRDSIIKGFREGRISGSEATDDNTLIIDVEGYVSGQMATDKRYTVVIKNKGAQFAGQGEWKLTNAKLITGKKTDAKIVIQPDGKGDVAIAYTAKDTQLKCNPRTFEIKKPDVINFTIVMDPDDKEVEPGKAYTFKINGYNGKGTWGVDGFEAPADKRAKTITVKALSGNKTAVVSFTPDGGAKQRKTIQVKANE
ncbi:MAG: hypothetical protein II644_00140 [Paludibacteraceae bacterium]|nr:hypothetical protein [Paludibacteraceae bacterium]